MSSLKPAGSLAAIIGGGLRSIFAHVAMKFLHIDCRGKERAILSGFTESTNLYNVFFMAYVRSTFDILNAQLTVMSLCLRLISMISVR